MPALNAELGTDFAVRVGVNTGSAVAGVVGTSKFSYACGATPSTSPPGWSRKEHLGSSQCRPSSHRP